jgi:hypothetical protein
MPRPRELDPSLLKALGHLPFVGVQYPIRLTAQSSYVAGRAALVFVGPHLLIPADDIAEFGHTEFWGEGEGGGTAYGPPHEGARIVAWFRPPEADRKYNIDFHCGGFVAGSFTLETSDGNIETTEITGPEEVAYEHVSVTFQADDNDWRWFSLSNTEYWRLDYCELTLMP